MMNTVSLSAAGRLAGLAPLILRLILGGIMLVHGWQKLQGGPAAFGRGALAGLGVPAPVLMGYVVTFTELIGGALLIVGLLSRLAALALTINLTVAIALVKVNVGLIAPEGKGAGAELDLALIAGFLAILVMGPGPTSLDTAFRLEKVREPSTPAGAAANEP